MTTSRRILLAAAALMAGAWTTSVRGAESAADRLIPALTAGYGANGPYALESRTVDNPGFRRRPVQVFLPQGAAGRRPVIFFSHGYGPGEWKTYADLITHLVSRGCIVVFSSYPAIMAGNEERYASLWAGFAAAAARFAAEMDLTRVGFVGHSFGGGATPAMAWRGLVQQRWGSHGAFLLELAPWYSFELTTDQLHGLPPRAVQIVEVYDRDSTNDHRMAIDLYRNSPPENRHYFLVRSLTVGGDTLTADHSTPGRNPSRRLKQYAVFRPLDAVMDWVFEGHDAGRTALAAMGRPGDTGAFQPLEAESDPVPAQPEGYYRNPWGSRKNPRLGPGG